MRAEKGKDTLAEGRARLASPPPAHVPCLVHADHFPLAPLASQTEATTCWANRGMVGVPMHEPVIFSCSGPKLYDAQTRKQEAIKHTT